VVEQRVSDRYREPGARLSFPPQARA
jgi:hypothetical protein